MAKYIELEAAKRHLISDYAYAAATMLDGLPVVDAVEVVRCKDCKHWLLYEPDVIVGKCVKHNDHVARWDDDFCSSGKRKDGDG